MLSPGSAGRSRAGARPRGQKGIPVIGEVELAGVLPARARSVGITGSNGKTTTTALIGHILKECGIACQVGGNIGTPPTAMVETSRDDSGTCWSFRAFQLETIDEFRAHIGCLHNVTPDHLDRHHTFENYAAAKGRLFETQTAGRLRGAECGRRDLRGVCIADRGDAALVQPPRSAPRKSASTANAILSSTAQPLIDAAEIPIRGRHNVENAMAAAAAAHARRRDARPDRRRGADIPRVEHRLEFVRERNGVRYYNDSKATNVDATVKAIDAFPGQPVDDSRRQGQEQRLHGPSRQAAQKAKSVLLIGAAAPKIAGAAGRACRWSNPGRSIEPWNARPRRRNAGRYRPAGAGLRELRPVREFRAPGRVFKELVRSL